MNTPIVQRTQRKAKSKRVCGLCLEAIMPGREYIHHKIRLNEQCRRKYTEGSYHIHCDALMDAYLADGWDNAYNVEDVETWLREKTPCAPCALYKKDCASPFDCLLAVSNALQNTAVYNAAVESIRAMREEHI